MFIFYKHIGKLSLFPLAGSSTSLQFIAIVCKLHEIYLNTPFFLFTRQANRNAVSLESSTVNLDLIIQQVDFVSFFRISNRSREKLVANQRKSVDLKLW